MLNKVVLVGRIIELKTKDNILIVSIISVNKGKENNIIDITIKGNIAENILKFCNKNDIIGISGSIESNKNKIISIDAEKVTFLSNKEVRGFKND